MVDLTENDVNDLMKQGFSMQEIQKAVDEVNREEKMGLSDLDKQYQSLQQQKMPSSNKQMSGFQWNASDNMIKWQLELNDLLERAEHFLKEDKVIIKENEVIWETNPTPESRIFTDYGVQEIMRILTLYINRNTILSDYEPQEIDNKVYDFGRELNDLFFMKYEDIFNFPKFDYCFKILQERLAEKKECYAKIYEVIYEKKLNDEELTKATNIKKNSEEIMELVESIKEEVSKQRRKNFPMIIRALVDVVHSSYNRAKYGEERDSLREVRQLMQQETLMPPNVNINTGEMRRERGLINPMRYIAGKFK